MGSPQRSINWADIIKRANTLGMILFIGLLAIAGLLFLLLDVIGWEGTAIRALVAMLLSPLIVGILFSIGWLALRASQQAAPDSDETNDGETNDE